jgi:hypothetical protein
MDYSVSGWNNRLILASRVKRTGTRRARHRPVRAPIREMPAYYGLRTLQNHIASTNLDAMLKI